MSAVRVLPIVLALGVAACSSDVAEPAAAAAGFRVINATQSPVDVLVDGATVVRGLAVAGLSPSVALAAGSHQVRLTSASGATTTLVVDGSAGRTLTTAVYPDTAGRVAAEVLQDTGAVVPAGKSKLRVVHMAANAGPITFWRTQPDWQTPSRIVTPFPYRFTTAYLQSDPGDWEVWITDSDSTVKRVTTGPIPIPSGARRTVVLLDSAGVTRFRVIPE
jgi:hypothetical protein